LHLVIVYGASFLSHSIAADVGPVLTFTPALVITYALVAAMIVVALQWHWLKEKHPQIAKWIFYVLCAIYFIRFFAT